MFLSLLYDIPLYEHTVIRLPLVNTGVVPISTSLNKHYEHLTHGFREIYAY